MFTGIIQHIATVHTLDQKPGLLTLTITAPKAACTNLQLGASIAIDGTCLTVTHVEEPQISFDIMQETLNKTTLSTLAINNQVNIERSLRIGDEMGGHIVSGHVHTTAEISKIVTNANNYSIHFQLSEDWLKYIFPKGFIAINGISLTIVDVNREQHTFNVCLIPETLARTNLSTKKIGDFVNIEVDQQTMTIVNTVTQHLKTLALT